MTTCSFCRRPLDGDTNRCLHCGHHPKCLLEDYVAEMLCAKCRQLREFLESTRPVKVRRPRRRSK